ncbi:MAG: hypothetical protein LBT09_06445 [Planctomycetaceae bacterium]|nr:hypothetical protein [Planctomycetaceae bacterium]
MSLRGKRSSRRTVAPVDYSSNENRLIEVQTIAPVDVKFKMQPPFEDAEWGFSCWLFLLKI